MKMLYTLLTIISNVGRKFLVKQKDIEEGFDTPYTISILYPTQDELDELV